MALATLGLSSPFKGIYRTICFALCLGLIVINLAGCSVSSSQDSNEQRAARPETLKTNVSIKDARELTRPAASAEGFSVQASQTRTGFAGLKTGDLFTENISNSGDRFNRLEDAVQDIRNEINEVSPSINRLVAIEGDIQELIVQLEVLLSEEPAAGTPEPKPEPVAQPPPKPVATAKDKGKSSAKTAYSEPIPITHAKSEATPKQPYVPHTGPPILQKIRMSDNPGTTRIVLETAGKMAYTAELDNGEQLLTIFFDVGEASQGISQTPVRSQLIKAISSTPQTEGLILAVSLGADSRIIKQGVIAPGKNNHNYRIYIDLAR